MRSALGFLAAGAMAVLAGTASAAVITLTDTTGDPIRVIALPGTSFQMQTTLILGPGDSASGLSFRLEASESNVFTITGRSVAAANPFTVLTNSEAVVLANGPGLDPSNGRDLGGITPDGLNRPPGTYELYTFTIAVAPTAPAARYQIYAIEGYYTNENFDSFAVPSSNYLVYTAVPEPIILGMMSVISGSLLLRRRARDIDGE